jgi:CheY-like chemotaxis protein
VDPFQSGDWTAFRAAGPGERVISVNDGLEAIAYMMGEGEYADRVKYPYPSFIITDLNMPGADGFEVLRHLKANPSWAVIPTVVLTSSVDPDDVRTAYSLGASSYHRKPVGYEELLLQIEILHNYWMTCEVPAVDVTGKQIRTNAIGKLGERFPQIFQAEQERVQ